jgi:hypothetical protein
MDSSSGRVTPKIMKLVLVVQHAALKRKD